MRRLWFLAALLCIITACLSGWWGVRYGLPRAVSAERGRYAGSGATMANRLRPFFLTDSSGREVSTEFFRGRWLIVFFGFTSCPDVCPPALFKISQAIEGLGKDRDRVRVAFITIDPEHDSPEILRAYLKPFGSEFVGLTGTSEQIDSAVQTFRAYAVKQPKTSDGGDSFKHSDAFFVLDARGEFRRQISSEATSSQLTGSLQSVMNEQPGR